MGAPRVALVVPGLTEGGGVPAVGEFLYRVLEQSGRFRPSMISIPMSSRDESSLRLSGPSSWVRGASVTDGEWEGKRYRHFGAVFTELEFQRLRPRKELTRALDEYDLVQVVAGAPCWATVARDVTCPVALQVATLVATERKEAMAGGRGPLGLWRSMMTRVVSRMDHAALQHVDVAFVENQWMLEHLSMHMDPERVVFAPPGVDTDLFVPSSPADPKPGHLLCVGRLSDPRKKVDLLFRSYATLLGMHPDAPRLVLAGSEGPTESDWEIADSLGIRDRIQFHRRLPVDELARLYREASVYILSSDEEGLGLVILEAMASGVPVVSTDCGGPSTSVVEGGTGFLVPNGDADALARRTAELLADPELASRLGAAGRARAVEKFSLRSSGELFLSTYDRLLDRAGVAAPA